MRPSRMWVPLILVILAIGLFFVSGQFRVPDPETPVTKKSRPAIKVDPPWPDPLYDEQGRQIVMIGDVPLHVPTNIKVLGIGSRDPAGGRKIGVCWTPDRFPGECQTVVNRVMITIKPSTPTAMLSTDEKIAEARSRLEYSTQSLEGPLESNIDGVLEYRGRKHKLPVVYVLKEPDITGRPIIMSCGFPFCNTHLHMPPALGIGVRFNERLVEHWPQIVRDVRTLVQSFLIEE